MGNGRTGIHPAEIGLCAAVCLPGGAAGGLLAVVQMYGVGVKCSDDGVLHDLWECGWVSVSGCAGSFVPLWVCEFVSFSAVCLRLLDFLDGDGIA